MKLSKNFNTILQVIINIVVGSIIILIPIGIVVAAIYFFGQMFFPIIVLGGLILWGAHSVGEFFIDKFKN